jgi:hypothetical protein
MSSQESVFEKIFGYHPKRDVQPPMRQVEIVRAIAEVRHQTAEDTTPEDSAPVPNQYHRDESEYIVALGNAIYTFRPTTDSVDHDACTLVTCLNPATGETTAAYYFGPMDIDNCESILAAIKSEFGRGAI